MEHRLLRRDALGEQHRMDALLERLERAPPCAAWSKASALISALTCPGWGESTRMREPTIIASSIEWVTNSTVNCILEESRASYEREGGIPSEEVKKMFKDD
jgi:hypothetical protein